MAKSRLSGGYCGNAVERGSDSEGSGISGRIDPEIAVMENSGIPARKCVSLNSSRRDGFSVPMQIVPLSKLSASQRKGLVNQLRSELEQVRLFQKKFETQRTSGVALSSSGDILSCRNGHNNGPQIENSRQPSKTGSLPGNKLKPLGQSQKPHGLNRGSSGKFESAAQTSSPKTANSLLMKDCETLLKLLMAHRHAWVFNTPVDVVKLNLPDYFSVIKHPMDLGTIKSKIAAGSYNGPLEFADDVRLTFSNAMTYNSPGTDVHIMADTLRKYFEVRWKTIQKKLTRKDPLPLPTKPNTCEDVKMTRPTVPSKKRKISPLPPQLEVIPSAKQVMSNQDKSQSEVIPSTKQVMSNQEKPQPEVIPSAKQVLSNQEKPQPEVIPSAKQVKQVMSNQEKPQPEVIPSAKQVMSNQEKPRPEVIPSAKKVMSNQEKQHLGRRLESLLAEMPDHIIDFLKEHSSNGRDCEEDEIEIDIDDLSDDTLFKLQQLLDEFCQEKQKTKAKVEVCEIEHLNDSGPRNSSLQAFKGSDPADVEVDIGRNDPPVSSSPLVEIKKDATFGVNKSLNLGSSDTKCSGSSDSEPDDVKVRPENVAKLPKKMGSSDKMDEKTMVAHNSERNQSSKVLDKLLDKSQLKPSSRTSVCYQDGECGPTERHVSPDKLYRAALLKNRFADTILKAREKTLTQGEKGDPGKLRRDREKLEMERRKEKARLQAEAKAAEDARKRAEAEAVAEIKRKRELEREAARQALLQMEKTVEINENSRFLEDLEMLRAVPAEQLLPSSVEESSPDISQDAMGSFKFGGSNPLEQLGLYMKADDEEEEGDALCVPNSVNEVEEGEID